MKRVINYVTYDAWWDTDRDILKEISKYYIINVFVINNYSINKFPNKEDYGFNSFHIFKTKLRDRNPLKFFSSLLFFVKLYRKNRSNAINLFIPGSNPYFLSLFFLFISSKNTIITFHNYTEHIDNRKSFFTRFKTLFLRKFNYFQFYSQIQRSNFQNDFPFKKSFCSVMPVKNFGIRKKERDCNKRTFLFFGIIRDYKRLDIYIEAAQNCNNSENAFFVIAGNSKNWDKYDKLINDYSRFQLDIKFIDDDEIPNYFSNSDFLVLPYDDATQSGPSLIALYYGLPIIASDMPIFKSLIQHRKNGYIFQHGNIEELTEIFNEAIVLKDEEIKKMRSNMLKLKEDYVNSSDLYKSLNNFINGNFHN